MGRGVGSDAAGRRGELFSTERALVEGANVEKHGLDVILMRWDATRRRRNGAVMEVIVVGLAVRRRRF